jgi:hypothetical protein
MCNCRKKKDKNYQITRDLAKGYATREKKVVALFFCSDWNFCELEGIVNIKSEIYEYFTGYIPE